MKAHFFQTGTRFGKWVIMSAAGGGQWNCRCECGAQRKIAASLLARGKTKSCKPCANAESHKRHAGYGTKLYKVWIGMRSRCANTSNTAYRHYGGRGIKVCAEWFDFTSFRSWAIASGYAEGLSIDRIDNDGNYEPENCRWTTRAVQSRNTRVAKRLEYQGKTHTLADLCKISGLTASAIRYRLNVKRMSVAEAVEAPRISHA